MAEPFLGEVKMVGFDFAPRNWALCNGAILQINQHMTLYALLGTTFGGDGVTTFALPDLRGRTPINSYANPYVHQGRYGGLEEVQLSINEMPAHTHDVKASNEPADAKAAKLTTNEFAVPDAANIYGDATSLVSFHETAVSEAGSSSAVSHQNMQPSLVTNFIIALEGQWPPRN